MKGSNLIFVFVFIFFFSITGDENASNIEFKGKMISINGRDGIKIKADIYEIREKNAPVILLFHQAGFSRGEYRETAPILNSLGFNCIAIDQRSGKGVNGVVNDSFLEASSKGLSTKYPDAFPDLEAALKFARKRYPSNKILVWGSSYSASLVFVLAEKYPEKITAIAAFSPGEYFRFNGKEIKEYARSVKCPVFVTSAKREHKKWKDIYESIPEGSKSFFLPQSDGVHGSRALWKSNPGYKEYWKALKLFLSGIKK